MQSNWQEPPKDTKKFSCHEIEKNSLSGVRILKRPQWVGGGIY